MGLPLTSFIWVGIDLTPCATVFAKIKALNTEQSLVEECHRVTGEWCLLLKVRLLQQPLFKISLIGCARFLE